MKYILFIVGFFVAWFLGIMGFCQIIGCLQHFGMMGAGKALFTIILWIVILAGVYFLVMRFLPAISIPFKIGYIVSFVRVLFAGEIQ